MKIVQIEYHRNGVMGEGFYAVIFDEQNSTWVENGIKRPERFMATVFKAPGHVSVFSVDRLKESGVTFGENSWRGDHYELELRHQLDKRAAEKYGANIKAWE